MGGLTCTSPVTGKPLAFTRHLEIKCPSSPTDSVCDGADVPWYKVVQLRCMDSGSPTRGLGWRDEASCELQWWGWKRPAQPCHSSSRLAWMHLSFMYGVGQVKRHQLVLHVIP